MSRNTTSHKSAPRQTNKPAPQKARTSASPAKSKAGLRRLLRLPVLPVFFLLTWLWAAWYYGAVFHIAREYSFWTADTRVMDFILCQPWGGLRYVGRAILTLYQYNWLGGLVMALLLTAGSWLTGYCLRLRGAWRAAQYLPAVIFIAACTYHGLDLFFEARTGFIFGIPFLCVLVLAACALLLRCFSHKPLPSLLGMSPEESPRQYWMQMVFIVLAFAAIVGFDQWQRPYVRVFCQMTTLQYHQDWNGVQKVAREHAIMSNRPMACSYAISLLQTQQIAERLYDIRLDYDSIHVTGMDGLLHNGVELYLPEGNYYAGFVESAMHSAMEQMVMTGPTIRLLKLQTKCALMRGEWELARKYLILLRRVPFEGNFCDRYEPYIGQPAVVNADTEMALIRLTEPLHDCFEHWYKAPLFMGYNIGLTEGRSTNALINSLSACLYTKLMPHFMERLQPLAGTTPPSIIADGIVLAETKQPGIADYFSGTQLRISMIQQFFKDVQPYMADRPGNAYELFPRFKGYYPYYYYFGNLKATKQGYTGERNSSSGGVN